MEELDDHAKSSLSQGFDLAEAQLVSKEKILAALSERISQLLAGHPDQLFSMLYRLDISERKIKLILQQKENISFHLAQLIYERQLEKAASRKQFGRQRPDNELSW
ncbi:MAG TPA: hypothetical protein VFL76_02930 [Edaphocola sp.]|nr:hypothetical protein [Edaphocola sp.]